MRIKLSVTIIQHIFQIFQYIVGNAELEKRFLICSNQRKVLISLATLELSELFPIEKCEDCREDLIGSIFILTILFNQHWEKAIFVEHDDHGEQSCSK